MRWRSALTVSGGHRRLLPWVRWIDTSILKTGDLARYRRSLLVDSARAPPRRRLSRSDLVLWHDASDPSLIADGRCRGEADMHRGVTSTGSVVDDPEQTSLCR